MTWDQLAVWTVVIGLIIAAAWLVIATIRRLWAWLVRRVGRRRLQARPTRPGPVALGPPRRVEVHARTSEPAQTRAEPVPHHHVEVDMRTSRPTQLHVALGPPRRTRVDLPPSLKGTPLGRGMPLIIPKRRDPLWVEKGWQRNGNHEYTGFYRAAGRQWRGLIREPYPGGFEAYIWDPPLPDLERRTHHHPCFRDRSADGRYKIHFHRAPTSLDHAIASVEAVLGEALGVRG
ncbi:MAG: hypothetical protein ACE5LU_26700 [Anaerolineae bacterium]